MENKLLNMDIKLFYSLAVPRGAGGDIRGASRELLEDRDKNLRVVPHPLGPAEPPQPSRPPPQLPKTGERGAGAAASSGRHFPEPPGAGPAVRGEATAPRPLRDRAERLGRRLRNTGRGRRERGGSSLLPPTGRGRRRRLQAEGSGARGA